MIEKLRIHTPDNSTREVPLDGDALTLGRAQENDLCYPDDASLSRKHLRFERDADGWSVVDLGSKNGTIVNGTRVRGRQPLAAGDLLTVGQLSIRCIDPHETSESNVVFVKDAGKPVLPRSATVMTSLEGVLSGDSDARRRVEPSAGAGGLEPHQQFQLPVVRALIRAGRELAGHQPLDELFKTILDQAITAVRAERGLLMTFSKGKLVPRATHGEGFRISSTVRDRVLQNKESLLVRDVGQEAALQVQMSISEQQIHSLMAVPLQTQNDVIGLIYVDSRLFVREFTPDDLNLLTVLANVAAIRIDHEEYLALQRQEQRRTRDLEAAAELQRSILPLTPPTVPGLDLAGHNAPCRTVGGDYYDFIPYPDGRLALVLADVAGKGYAAALLMTGLQARVQLLTEEPAPLGSLVSRLDRSITTPNFPVNRFITLFMCEIDPQTGDTVYCNAGHNPALIVRSTGEVAELPACGSVLGVLPDLGYEERRERLEPGELIAIYSDGVTEATGVGGEEFGEQRLADLLIAGRNDPAHEIVRSVNAALAAWSASDVAEDDITLLVARRLR